MRELLARHAFAAVQAYVAADGLACHNLIMLLAYCYSAGLVAADCMYRCDRHTTAAAVTVTVTVLVVPLNVTFRLPLLMNCHRQRVECSSLLADLLPCFCCCCVCVCVRLQCPG